MLFVQHRVLWESRPRTVSVRKLPPKYSTIPHRTTVYNDVVTYFSWQDGDLFGIEIHNPAVAQAQRQYFELLWDLSYPITKD